MSLPCFVINNRFVIDPALNVIQDRQQGKESRVEPRLMEVLCFLAHRSNQVVTREELIKAIWKEVGSGEEGLTQAISFLRKTLDDQDRQTIETIPKRGYVLKASIGKSFQQEALQAKSQVFAHSSKDLVIQQGTGTKKLYFTLLLLLCLLGTYLMYVHFWEKQLLPTSWKEDSYSRPVTNPKPKVAPRPTPTPKPYPN